MLSKLGIFQLRNEAELAIYEKIEKFSDEQLDSRVKNDTLEIVSEEIMRIKYRRVCYGQFIDIYISRY